MDEEEEPAEEGAPAWMATFSDLMSLMLTFFVLLLSFSTMDVIKFRGMVGSMRQAFGVQVERPGMHVGMTDDIVQVSDFEKQERAIVDSLVQSLKKSAKERGYRDAIEVSVGREGVLMRIPGDLMFDAGTSAVNPRAFVFLDDIAKQAKAGNWDVAIEGHTDSAAPKGQSTSNWRLASDRAISTLEYLAEAGKVSKKRLSATSYADSRPIAANNTPGGRARNRRVELLFRPPEQRAK